jgi:alpha-tubulin suppressor-like RCC1 family protein
VPSPRELVPREVLGLEQATELAAGDFHTCARGASGLRCWGWNSRGQLGDGTLTESYVPRAVSWP